MVADSACYVVFNPLTGETKRAKADANRMAQSHSSSLGELTPTSVSLYGRQSGANPEAETLSDEQPRHFD
jgi:hypothetical protein